MTWFLFALAAPLLWAITTHADAYLARTQYRHTGLAVTMAISGVANVLTAAICFVFGASFIGNPWAMAAAFVGGLFGVLYLMPYYFTLEYYDEVVTASFFQLIPPLTLFFGWIFLGENLTLVQLCAVAIVMVGALWLSFHHVRRGWVIDLMLVSHMGLSSILFATAVVLFKYAGGFEPYVSVMFWFALGGSLPILAVVLGTLRSREDLFHLIHHHVRHFLGAGALAEGSDQLAVAAQRYASLLAPVGLVQVVGSLMPLSVYLLSSGLRRFAPSLAFPAPRLSSVEKISHAAAITVIIIGAGAIALLGNS